MTKYLKNPHPGEILQEEFLEPLCMSQNELAIAIDVPSNRISEIVRGRRGITADTDLRLARYFDLSEGYWLRLQNAYDMMEVKRSKAEKAIYSIKPHHISSTEAHCRAERIVHPPKRVAGSALTIHPNKPTRRSNKRKKQPA